MRRPHSLASRLFTAQLLVIAVTFLSLLVTIVLVAPGLFMYHLEMTGEDSPTVQQHAQEAFETSVGFALLAAAAVAIVAAILLSWFLARRVSRPVTDLAVAAESVARGKYDVEVPDAGFGAELHTLSQSFRGMADGLASTDDARARLLSDLSHEIRTPLATLEAHIDGLEDGLLPSDPATYEVMRAQVRRLQRLASDVRLAAQAQEHALDLQPQLVSVSQLVEAACALYEPRYQDKGVVLRNTCHEDETIRVDPDRMQQVLINLLDNALRHTPAGGSVDVSCQRRPDFVDIDVRDSGEGIPPGELDAIFQRFHRLDDSRGHGAGSGLGLTIARAIVQDHGGTMTSFSAGLGTGARFTVSLPSLRSADGHAASRFATPASLSRTPRPQGDRRAASSDPG